MDQAKARLSPKLILTGLFSWLPPYQVSPESIPPVHSNVQALFSEASPPQTLLHARFHGRPSQPGPEEGCPTLPPGCREGFQTPLNPFTGWQPSWPELNILWATFISE